MGVPGENIMPLMTQMSQIGKKKANTAASRPSPDFYRYFIENKGIYFDKRCESNLGWT
jgi:hypothetical protein